MTFWDFVDRHYVIATFLGAVGLSIVAGVAICALYVLDTYLKAKHLLARREREQEQTDADVSCRERQKGSEP